MVGVGGRGRVHELAALVPASANAGHYARIVREMAILRGLIVVGQEIAGLGYDRPGEVHDLIDKAEQKVFSLAQGKRGDFARVESLLGPSYHRIQDLHEHGVGMVRTLSGFRDLDRATCGFAPGSLTVVAARPSMGKTALGLGMLANLGVRSGVPGALFSMEMTAEEIATRLICAEAKVDSVRVIAGEVEGHEWKKLTQACGLLETAPIYIDDSAQPTMADIRSKVRVLKAKNPTLGLVIVDYLQLMSEVGAENRTQEISSITRKLKVMARDLQVPIVALSQLSREVERRSDKRPMLSDLRDSGSIEQDADLVIFIYRDEYYHEDSDRKGQADIIIAKHRNGPTSTVRMAFLGRYAAFSDLAYD